MLDLEQGAEREWHPLFSLDMVWLWDPHSCFGARRPRHLGGVLVMRWLKEVEIWGAEKESPVNTPRYWEQRPRGGKSARRDLMRWAGFLEREAEAHGKVSEETL